VTATSEVSRIAFGDERGPAVFSVAMGRYLTPSLRMELGLDFRTKQKVVRGGSFATNRRVTNGANYDDWAINHSEEGHVQSNTYMLNGYYDILRAGRFRPYVGAGIGLATHNLTRQYTESTTCVGSNNLGAGICNLFVAPVTPSNADGNATGVGLAASLMAGVNIDLSARTHLDIGYRFMWQGGRAALNLPSAFGSSMLDVADRKDHEIRTTLRFDLW
jgi:opacity protein-like surface antigen